MCLSQARHAIMRELGRIAGRNKGRKKKHSHIENKMVVHGNLFFNPSQIITTPFARNKNDGQQRKKIHCFQTIAKQKYNAEEEKGKITTPAHWHISSLKKNEHVCLEPTDRENTKKIRKRNESNYGCKQTTITEIIEITTT